MNKKKKSTADKLYMMYMMAQGIAIMLVVLIAIVAIIWGYGGGEIKYKGKLRPITEVEEIIADELEVENPDMDIEVNISEERDN